MKKSRKIRKTVGKILTAPFRALRVVWDEMLDT